LPCDSPYALRSVRHWSDDPPRLSGIRRSQRPEGQENDDNHHDAHSLVLSASCTVYPAGTRYRGIVGHRWVGHRAVVVTPTLTQTVTRAATGQRTIPPMFRRALVVAVALLAACGGDDDDDASGGPAREGTSADWAEAWTADATEECGGQCVVFEAIDGEIPAADAEPANFTIHYDPGADPVADGWAAVQDFADEVGCVLPLQPIKPTPISCAAG
jgi:hypothetical protein